VLSRVIKSVREAPPKSVPFQKQIYILSELSNTIQCIAEPRFQHDLYPRIMKAMLEQKFHSAPLMDIEKEIWDSALYSLKMDNSILQDNIMIKKGYEDVLSSSTYRKQEGLPFPQLLKEIVREGTFVLVLVLVYN